MAHLALAELAADQLALEQVLFLPVGQPTHKNTLTAVHHRLAMTELAIAGHPRFVLDTADADRPPPHYTATLLPILRQRYPARELWLLMGSDSLADLPRWHNPTAVIAHARLAVLTRVGAEIEWGGLEAAVPGVGAAVQWLVGEPLPLSSSAMRQAVARGQAVGEDVPAAVRAYITQHQLY
jgi:nicotinate-nucleotide adenylyltransferase